ncbi:snare region anchored in the vesicle membrane C-terminus-domain-containing protein [Tuber brumale]|nr:snare region anchored in the vesicle membrane C-terminus-domain-containing protein [Tuber brumale]
MATSTSNSWAQLRQQARSLESQTDNLFHTYSSFVSNPAAKPSEAELRTESQLQEILQKRETVVSSLSRLLDSETALTSSATKLQNLSLHRSTLTDHRREFIRLKGTISESRSRTHLLSSVRDDINAFRSASRIEEGRSEADYMLDERDRIDNSHNIADSVLSQAYAIQSDFTDQRQLLGSINRRIVHSASQIPGINTIIAKINTRKKRDSIILAGLIAACFLMVLWFR